LNPNYQPERVNTDGWDQTQTAWRTLTVFSWHSRFSTIAPAPFVCCLAEPKIPSNARCYNGCMKLEWDENKAARNQSKHGVSFEEAKTVFEDPLYVDFYDPDHSDDEERYLIVRESNRGRLLIMSYTERGDSIRLISAREVTLAEREAYEEG